MTRAPWIVFATLAFAVASAAAALAASEEEAAIAKLADRYAEAWNKGDSRALAALYDGDAIYVEVTGVTTRGRAEIEKIFAGSFAGPWKDSRLTISPGKTQFLKPDVALAEGSYELAGLPGPDGKTLPTRKGVYLNILVKKGGDWLLVAVSLKEPVL